MNAWSSGIFLPLSCLEVRDNMLLFCLDASSVIIDAAKCPKEYGVIHAANPLVFILLLGIMKIICNEESLAHRRKGYGLSGF